MKANEVLRILSVSSPTLCKYVKEGKIKVTELPNGMYDYDEKSVYRFLNKDIERKTYIYARLSIQKQKPDPENQINLLKQFCFNNNYITGGVFNDIASGISFEKRNDFFKLLDEVLCGRVERVVIAYKDRLCRVDFQLFKCLFKRFETDIVVMLEIGSERLDSKEVFEEIVSLLHCYSMKLYS